MSGYYDNYPAGLEFCKDVAGSTLGFANRNQISTSTGLTWPCRIQRLGADFAAKLEEAQYNANSNRANPRWAPAYRAPGILVFDVEPLFAPTRVTSPEPDPTVDEQIHYSEEIYNSLWSYLRLYDAAVGEFQACDLAAIDWGNMLVRYYLSFLMKALRALNTTAAYDNRYQHAMIMLRALGFTSDAENEGSVQNTLNALPGIIKRLNGWLMAQSKLTKVLVNVFPGASRLPALMTEWYRDVEEETDCAQMYTFKPASWWTLSYSVQRDQETSVNLHCWNIVKSSMPTSIQDYVNKLIRLMNSVCLDESALQVQRYLNKIVESGTTMPGDVSVTTMALGDVIYPDSATIGFDTFESKFDRDMLLAIHNMTICEGYTVTDAIQDPGQVRWNQYVRANNSYWGDTVTRFSKPIDLPWVDATPGDFINALQWNVVRHAEASWSDTQEVDPMVLGSELIVKATIWSCNDDKLINPGITSTPLHQIVLKEIDQRIGEADTAMLTRLMFFNHAPMVYLLSGFNRADNNAGQITDVITQGEVFYVNNYRSCAAIKYEYIKNYWGWPFIIDNPGTFSTHTQAATPMDFSHAPATNYGSYSEGRDYSSPSAVYDRRGNSGMSDKRTKRSQKYKNSKKKLITKDSEESDSSTSV